MTITKIKMSGSRKSFKKRTIFNPRASNEWSKDESKFGQRMLEKMGWKHGQGIGLNNQGITENIKVRLKLDNKGLGYQIKEDQWLEVRSEFSELLSQLSKSVEDQDETIIKEKKSLEAVSQSSKTRVHYHKFTHGKDVARYKKEDLIGILGEKEDEEELIRSKNKAFFHGGNMNEYFKSKKSKLKESDVDVSADKSLIVDNENNHWDIKPVQEENASNSQSSISNLNSQKVEKCVETCNSEDFFKPVIDYNSCNNVEDYISNFEKNRDELMNKYREKYKMKYLISSSNQIQIFGDEFDGRKLDCKKSDLEEVCVKKTVDLKKMSKAEKIVAKARLLKSIKDNSVTHNFEGSNLTKILGYGSEIY